MLGLQCTESSWLTSRCADGDAASGKQVYVPADCASVEVLAPEEWLVSDVCRWQ